MGEPVLEGVVGHPGARLGGAIDRYVGYRFAGLEPGTHQGLPSGRLAFVVTLDAPLRLTTLPDGRADRASLAAMVAGLHTRPATIAHDGASHGIQLDLHPLAARRLLGLPAGALAGHVVDLAELLGRPGRELQERVVGARSWADRFAVLDEVLGDRLARSDAPAPHPAVAEAWRRLERSGGRVGVAELSAELGWSRRHLGERFRAELGVAPKAAARVLRFDRARRLLQGADRPSPAQVAAACGYADQAHLNRDFVELAGAPPVRWLSQELPSFQDGTPEGLAG